MNPTIAKLMAADNDTRAIILGALSPEELAIVYRELDLLEKSPKRHWYCPRADCGGNPHVGFHWCEHPIDGEHKPYCKHARTPQRPPAIDPDNPWLVWMFMGGRGTGKALALDTPIPTPFGWAKMGELKEGDVVFDERGRMCNVTAIYDVMPERAYRLTFSDGSEIVACDEHQWATLTAQERKQLNRKGLPIPDDWANKAPITTADIVATLKYGKRGDTNHAIPVSKPLELPNANLPIDPYILGVWLGDGSSGGADITCHDDDIAHYRQKFDEVGEIFGEGRYQDADKPTATYRFGNKPKQRNALGQMTANGSMHSKLRELGLINNKHVPAVYFRGSVSQRISLLHGLMDTDGYIDERGMAEFTSTKRVLAEAVVELARSLGQKPVMSVGRSTLYGKDCGEKYRVHWRPTIEVVSLPRKLERQKPYGAQSMRNHHRMVVSATEELLQPMRCITVDSPNSMYLAGEAMIPTHNTRSGAEWVLDLVWNQGYKRIALIGRTPADVRDVMIWGDSGIMNCSDPHPKPLHEPTKRRLLFANGAECFTYSAAAPDQLRGPQHDAAWGDEIAAWSDAIKGDSLDTSYNNLMLGLRLGEHPQALFTTTPKRVRLVKEIMERKTTAITNGTTYDNLDNLAGSFRESVLQAYEGTRIGQQELLGLMMTDVDGALFTQEMIDPFRGFLVSPEPEVVA